MSYSKLIHDYLDGELNTTQEDVLFAELSGNEEVRGEFNRQMKLHGAARSDASFISPPPERTGAVFAALGFSAPVAEAAQTGAATAQATAAKVGAVEFVRNNIATFVTALVTSALTAVVVLLIQNYYSEDAAKPEPPTVTSEASEISSTSDIPIVNASELSNTGERITSTRTASSFNNSSNSGSGIGSSDRTGDAVSPIVSVPTTSEPIEESSGFSRPKPISEGLNLFKLNRTERLRSSEELSPEYSFAFSPRAPNGKFGKFDMLAERSFTEAANGVNVPGSNSAYDNLSVAAIYNFDERNSLGLRIGKTTYGQKFDFEKDGRTLVYIQNPSLWSASLIYRRSFEELAIGEFLTPYARVSFGGTSLGPTAGMQLGAMIYPIDSFYFSLAIETNGLIYSTQNSYQTSLNYGISGGIGYNFDLY